MFASSLISTVLSLSVLTAPTAADPDPVAPVDDGGTTAAVDALAEVRYLLDGLTSLLPATGTGGDLTLALRDLALLKDELPPALQPVAEGYLARPTDGGDDQFGDGYRTSEATPVCSDVVCVHYVTSTSDKVPAADSNANDVPDYVDFALATMSHVDNAYVAAGYRAPRGDGNRGGNAKPDIYLADVGGKGLYGYCATDEDFPTSGPQNAWGYCVLDNDYAGFPAHTPAQNFQVTAAHEYFHAVQFGYDISEDPWVMEATATWAEDELYDSVNDNLQYLRYGPMRHPGTPMDLFQTTGSGLFHYGTWSFFRFLTERFGASKGGMPTLVRDLWRRLDDAPGGPDDYSLEGLVKVLRTHKLSLPDAFASYSAANRMPARSYDEGRANHYPAAPLLAKTSLAPGRLKAASRAVTLDHLTAATVRYTPGKKLKAAGWKLRLRLNLAPRWKGSNAVVTIVPRHGAPRRSLAKLNKAGDLTRVVGFSSRSVKYVEVTLVNASDDFTCNRRTWFSCSGRPKFDNQVERVSAQAFRR